MKVIINIIVFIFSSLHIYCQSPTSITPCKIGDKITPLPIVNILNYSSSEETDLSEFKGKLVLLDFMTTGCVPCINVLPHLDSLQKQFGNKLKIILVSPEKRERVESFLKKNKYLSLSFIVEDSNLSKLFPHIYISHVAWINSKGIVSAITHTEYITAKNIETLLDGKTVDWPVKRDITTYDVNQPLLQLNESNIPEFSLPTHYFYTTIVNYMPGIQKYANNIYNTIIVDSIRKIVRTVLINYSIIDLYLILNQEPVYLPKTQILLELNDKDRLIYNPAKGYYGDWENNNFYCMEAIFPADKPLELQREKLLNDLDFYLGLMGRVEKRFVECLILKNTHLSTTHDNKNIVEEGLTLGSLVGALNDEFGAIPVINESANALDLKFPITKEQLSDKKRLAKILSEYGLELNPERREIEFLVIKDL